MSETKSSNGDSTRASKRGPETKRRVASFVLLLALTIGLVAFVETNTWRQLEQQCAGNSFCELRFRIGDCSECRYYHNNLYGHGLQRFRQCIKSIDS